MRFPDPLSSALQQARHVVVFTGADVSGRAGSSGIVKLHGSLFAPRCSSCSRAWTLDTAVPQEPEGGRCLKPPACRECGGLVRPGVVWFGEALPADALEAAFAAAASCDLLLSVGTSSLVHPAAQVPAAAKRAGALVVQVNPNPTALDAIADYNLRGSAASLLPELNLLASGRQRA